MVDDHRQAPARSWRYRTSSAAAVPSLGPFRFAWKHLNRKGSIFTSLRVKEQTPLALLRPRRPVSHRRFLPPATVLVAPAPNLPATAVRTRWRTIPPARCAWSTVASVSGQVAGRTLATYLPERGCSEWPGRVVSFPQRHSTKAAPESSCGRRIAGRCIVGKRRRPGNMAINDRSTNDREINPH